MSELLIALQKNGYNNFQPICDGNLYRFHDERGSRGNKSCWFVGHTNYTNKGVAFIVARYGSFSRFETLEFQTEKVKLSAPDRAIVQKNIKDAQIKIKKEREELHKKVAEQAQFFWNQKCSLSMNCNYLKKKKIPELYGAKTAMLFVEGLAERALAVPLQDVDGEIWSIQFIGSIKKFMPCGKKRGCFFVLGGELGGQDTIYIAEGFSTAASIHQAIGQPVVVAFDAGNLESVGVALNKKYESANLIFCADDDSPKDPNAGLEAAQNAAKRTLGSYVLPVFQNKGTSSDFNDLHDKEGLDVVKSQVLNTPIVKHPKIKFLGYKGDTHFFMSTYSTDITGLKAATVTEHTLWDLMPDQGYWETKYPNSHPQSKDPINWKQAKKDIVMLSRAAGRIRDEKIRASGVWSDNGNIIVNSGDEIWSSGQLIDLEDYKSKYTYTFGDQRCAVPTELAATKQEMTTVANLLSELPWKGTHESYLLMGWMFIAPLCGALDWRPHIWLTAPMGAGKSWIQNNIVMKLVSNSVSFLGGTTEAGLRQSMGSSAVPVIYDEAETTDADSKRRIQKVIELFRHASTDTNAKTAKGTAGGTSLSFKANFCGIMSSINVGIELAQDAGRFTLLELVKRESRGFEGPNGLRSRTTKFITEELGERMFARSINKIDDLFKQIKIVQTAINEMKDDSRFSDQMAPMVAGYIMAVSDAVLPVKQVKDSILGVMFNDLNDEQEANEGTDSSGNCLETLILDTVIVRGETRTFLEIINDAFHENFSKNVYQTGDTESNKILMRYGLKVVHDRDDDALMLAVQISSASIKKRFYNTEWAVSYQRSLLRLQGVKKGYGKFFSKSVRVVKIPRSVLENKTD